jgi:hypothetical protein
MPTALNADLQASVLALLTNIAALRSDFVSTTIKQENGTTHNVRPSISTFSDHIVTSYSLAPSGTALAFLVPGPYNFRTTWW